MRAIQSARSLEPEVFRLDDEHYALLGVHKDEALVDAEPFEVHALQLALLWADVAKPT